MVSQKDSQGYWPKILKRSRSALPNRRNEYQESRSIQEIALTLRCRSSSHDLLSTMRSSSISSKNTIGKKIGVGFFSSFSFNFCSRRVALNSPELNLMDFVILGILESKACAEPHILIKSLKRSLKKAWAEIPMEMISKIVDEFPKRLKKCVAANGGHFESK